MGGIHYFLAQIPACPGYSGQFGRFYGPACQITKCLKARVCWQAAMLTLKAESYTNATGHHVPAYFFVRIHF